MGGEPTYEIKYMWIDKDIGKENFQNDYNFVFKNNECELYDNVDKPIKKLIEEKSNEFIEMIIIISGEFFFEFYNNFIENILKINVSPIIAIYCWEKDKVIYNLKFNGISLNRFSLNENFIFNQPIELLNFIKGIKTEERDDITFDQIQNINELIIPCYYSYLIEDATQSEIDFFNQNIILNFQEDKKENKNIEKKIKKMIKDLKRGSFDHKALVSKYWLRIYSLESSFYPQMNKALREQDENHMIYEPLIKICYESIRKRYFNYVIDKKLYRGQLISRGEFQNYETLKKRKDNNEIQNIIIYCRCFLSFSEEPGTAEFFMNRKPVSENTVKVLFEIEKIDNAEDIDLNTLSNCSIEQISANASEKEILFFPFSCFEVIDIDPKDGGNYYLVSLKYLGKYGKAIRQQLGENFFENIQMTKFSEEFVIANLMKNNKGFKSIWKTQKEYKNYKGMTIFILDNKNDIVFRENNSFSIISLFDEKMKLNLNFSEIEILSMIKLKNDEICFSTSNNYIQIIQLFERWKSININIRFQTKTDISAYNLIYLSGNNENILFINQNKIYCISKKEQVYELNKLVEDNLNISLMEELPNHEIIYLTENNNNTFIHFFDLINFKKNSITIKKKFNKCLTVIKNYCAIGFIYNNVYVIEFIDFEQKKSIFFFELNYMLTNMMKIDNKLIIGLFGKIQNNCIFRELFVDLKTEKPNVYVLGEGKIDKNIKMKNVQNNHQNMNLLENSLISNSGNNIIDINTNQNKNTNNFHLSINDDSQTENNDDNDSQNEIIIDTNSANLIKPITIKKDTKVDDDKIQNIIELNDECILVNTIKGRLIKFKRINETAEIFKENFYKYNNNIDAKHEFNQKLSINKYDNLCFKKYNLKLYNDIEKRPIPKIINDEFDEDLLNYCMSQTNLQSQSNSIINEIRQGESIYKENEQSNNAINVQTNENSKFEYQQKNEEENKEEGKKEEEKKEEEKKEEEKKEEEKKEEVIMTNEIINEKNEEIKPITYEIKKGVVDFGFPFACNHPLTINKENIRNKKKIII